MRNALERFFSFQSPNEKKIRRSTKDSPTEINIVVDMLSFYYQKQGKNFYSMNSNQERQVILNISFWDLGVYFKKSNVEC